MLKYFSLCVLLLHCVFAQTNKPPLEEKTLDEILAGITGNDDFGVVSTDPQNPPISGVTTAPPISEVTAEPLQDQIDCLNGECVPAVLCSSNNTVNIYGSYLTDDRFGTGNPSSKLCNYLEVCCGGKDIRETPKLPPSVRREGCGNRYVNGTGLTNVGHTLKYAQFGELPWTVAVIKDEILLNIPTSTNIAGGSLIHPRVILTSAHNVYTYQPNQLKIRAGEWDTQTDQEIYPYQERRVTDIIIHQDFYKPANLNDIALLILDQPFELSDHIQTACLPSVNSRYETKNCIATGWGKDSFDESGQYQNILKKIVLPIVSRDQCESKLRTTQLSNYFQLHDSFICAGGTAGVDTCTGDGGAPLVCPIEGGIDRYYQVGIVSWGIGCNRDLPGVYVNVPMFKSWIDQQFNLRRLETKYYTP